MMKNYILITLLLLSSTYLFSQNRCLIKVKDKYGYIDTLGNIVISPKYEYASQYSEGFAIVGSNNKYGYINTSGKVVIPINHENVTLFRNGVATVRKNHKCGLIDTTGRMLVDYIYDDIPPSLNDENRIGVRLDNKYGFINMEGHVEVDIIYYSVSKFSNGISNIEINGYDGIIDTTGKYILEPKYRQILVGYYSNNRIAVLEKGKKKYQYVDMNGDSITETKFEYADEFSEGYAFVREDYSGLGYYIDTSGNKAFSKTFKDGGPFNNGLATVQINGKFGIINLKGDYITSPIYDEITSYFHDGFIIYITRKKNKTLYGLIGINGQEITPPIYTCILIDDGDCIYPELYKNGKDTYDRSQKLGYVNRKGEIIWKPKK